MTSKEKFRVALQIREEVLRVALEAERQNLRILGVRALTTEDLRALTTEDLRALSKEDLLIAGVRPLERPGRLFNALAKFLDLLLEPDAAETAIGDLAEMYRQRSERSPGYAKVWLLVQVGWLVYGRAMDVYSRFTRARAGK
jgi:hypothetical protein